MRTFARQQPELSRNASLRRRSAYSEPGTSARLSALAALLAGLFLFAAGIVAAQAPSAPSAPAAIPAQPPIPAGSGAAGQKPSPVKKPAAAAPVYPKPDWPVDNQPTAAAVTWDSHGLFINASNSSLDQILREVSLETGIKVEGMGADERIFGAYGPGPANEVLGELLDGSAYDVLMIGDQGEGTPRRIVLTARTPAGAQPASRNSPVASASNEEESEPEPLQAEPPPLEPPPPQPSQSGPVPGVPVRTPQQIMEQMQQRQQEIQQQRQENQQNPQN